MSAFPADRKFWPFSEQETARLLARYRPKMHTTAVRFWVQCGRVVPLEDFEDAANHALHLTLRNYDPKRKWSSTYLYRAARSQMGRVVEHYNRQKRRGGTVSLDLLTVAAPGCDGDTLGELQPDPGAEFEAAILDRAEREELRARLWQICRSVKWGEEIWHEAHEVPLSVRAKVLGISREGVRRRRLVAHELVRELAQGGEG